MSHKIITDRAHLLNKYFKVHSTEPEFMKQMNFVGHRGGALNNVIFFEIPSLSSLHKFMKENNPHNVQVKFYMSSREVDSKKWRGTKTWDEYIKLLDNGDERVMNQIKLETQDAVNTIEKTYALKETGYKYDVAGQFFDIGLVLSGVPETWLEPVYEDDEKPKMTLRVNMGFMASTESRDVIKNGALILGMAKVLENLGVEISIELWTFTEGWSKHEINGKRMHEVLVTKFIAKDFDEPVNFIKLSSLLTTSYLRRGMFRIREVLEDGIADGNYGGTVFPKEFITIHDTNNIRKFERDIFQNFKKGA